MDLWPPLFRVSWSHTYRHTWQDSSGWAISPSQRPLPTQDNTTYKHKRHPCPDRDSNPRPQQQSGRRPTTYTARPLGSAWNKHWWSQIWAVFINWGTCWTDTDQISSKYLQKLCRWNMWIEKPPHRALSFVLSNKYGDKHKQPCLLARPDIGMCVSTRCM
jgi:hypothetical protein